MYQLILDAWENRRVQDSLGLYLSVPFCKAKCSFCNFASDAFGPERMDGYVARLCAEIRSARRIATDRGLVVPGTVDTVYFGGGTPSLLGPQKFEEIFAALHGEFDVLTNAEITMECAPGQIAEASLQTAMRLGVSRVSLGVQSFVDRESAAVGRLHTGIQCENEIARLKSLGLDVGFDLICGLPHQTRETWRDSLQRAVATGAHHVSVYMLEVDEDSRLGRELIGPGVRYGAGTVPDDGAVAEMYLEACDALSAGGLLQYEISNFAREGQQSRHNRKYWERAPYLGFGLDAHSMLLDRQESAVRFANGDDLDTYLGDVDLISVERVDDTESFEEKVFLGLRLNEGVESLLLSEMSGSVDEMVQARLMWSANGRFGLTPRGRVVSSSVFGELLAAPV
jgi:oxygen-independent coproporphyrinogen III oxidase